MSFVLHNVGNKSRDENIHLSKRTISIDHHIKEILLKYFLSPFSSNEFYNLYHESDINLNEVFSYVSKIFDSSESLLEQSIKLTRHLYEQSTHPKIKGGEFYIVYFRDCIVEGETVDAVGLFKSETKDTFLKVYPQGDSYAIESEDGVNINKLDKGCMIYNTEREYGYLVSVVDNLSKSAEAQYWIDHFLHIRPRNDEYFQTKNTLSLCKQFVVDQLPEQFGFSKADQVALLNKSMKFFKENENFNIDEFAHEVIQDPGVINSFKSFKSDFEKKRDYQLNENFIISDSAVKKQSRVFKSVIKLDNNFHIYIHGNREFIEKGYDKETGMNFYRIFFKEES